MSQFFPFATLYSQSQALSTLMVSRLHLLTHSLIYTIFYVALASRVGKALTCALAIYVVACRHTSTDHDRQKRQK